MALLIFAVGTAASMALLSTAFGLAIATGPLARNFERAAPVLGVLAAAFGIWYAASALETVAYPLESICHCPSPPLAPAEATALPVDHRSIVVDHLIEKRTQDSPLPQTREIRALFEALLQVVQATKP